MRVLAIETSGEACSVALFDGDQLIAHDHRIIGRGHAEMLVPMIAALPNKGRAQRIIVSLGPGSFTGVRIGIATARALGIAWNAEVLGYPSLALCAAMALNEVDDAEAAGVTVCINGGHGEWFIQNFDKAGAPETPVASLSPQNAMKHNPHLLIAGNKAVALSELFQVKCTNTLVSANNASFTNLISESTLTSNLAPIYGRAPDAKPQKAAVQ